MSINLRTLDLNLLRMLVAVDETGSVSQAGAGLGLSQPAASNALARLRLAFGDPLFVRTRDGMVPTAFAERVLPDIRRHLAGIFDTLGQTGGFDFASSDRVFRLSLSGLGETLFLPRLAVHAMAAAPAIRIFNVAAPLEELPRTLAAGRADLAMGMITLESRGLRSRDLFEEFYLAVAAPGLPRRPDSLEALRRERILVSAPAATYARDIDDVIERNGLTDNVVLRVAHFGALPRLLSQMQVVTIVPSQFAEELQAQGQATILPIRLSRSPANIRMVWHERTEFDAACAWMRTLVEDLFGSTPSPGGPTPGSR